MSENTLQEIIKQYDLENQFSRISEASPYVLETVLRYSKEISLAIENQFWFSDVDYSNTASNALPYFSDIFNSSSDIQCKQALRKFRNFHSARLLWLDLNDLVNWQALLKAQSDLADLCTQAALSYLEHDLTEKYHKPKYLDGSAMQLSVIAMGKWGGQELNFSSDIDFILLYGENVEVRAKDGRRDIETHQYFIKLSQRLIRLLDDKTADGFVYRCDTRLRPFGESGPLVLSIAALEQYLTSHGREWERYAYLKARCVTGDSVVCNEFKELRRPFVYRRYLDFGVFAKLRDMHAQIAEQVRKKEFQENLKLGRGGIRECEFLIQAMQLLRGGRLQALQQTNFYSAYQAIQNQDIWVDENSDLLNAYIYLRILENRLQALHQEQTHELPSRAEDQAALLAAMQVSTWNDLLANLNSHRERVVSLFDEHMSLLNLNIDDSDNKINVTSLLTRLEVYSANLYKHFNDLFQSRYYANLNDKTQKTLDSLLSLFLDEIELHDKSKPIEIETATRNFLKIIRSIGKRAVYYALLVERPAALKHLLKVCFVSDYLCEQIAQRPILLDELLDPRIFSTAPNATDIQRVTKKVFDNAKNADVDRFVNDLVVHKHVQSFRIATAEIFKNLPLMKVSDRLSDVAENILKVVVQRVLKETLEKFSLPEISIEQSGFAILAYGKLGGLELSYSSDLDIVFLYDKSEFLVNNFSLKDEAEINKFYTRLVQQCLRYLNMPSSMGRLYEIDTRLRPSGNSGFLISSIQAFQNYQENEAWVWEHQALTRSRVVLGSENLGEKINQIRLNVLSKKIDITSLNAEIFSMRQRMLKQFLSKNANLTKFHLKHSPGGMIDIEFLVQYLVLKHSGEYSELLRYSDNIRQLESLAKCGILKKSDSQELIQSYINLREHVHLLSLHSKEPVIDYSVIEFTRQIVLRHWHNYFEQIE